MSCPWSWISALIFCLHILPWSAIPLRIPYSLWGWGWCFSVVHPVWLLLPHGERSPPRAIAGTSLPTLGRPHSGKSEMSDWDMFQSWGKPFCVQGFLHGLLWFPRKCIHLLRVHPSVEVQDFWALTSCSFQLAWYVCCHFLFWWCWGREKSHSLSVLSATMKGESSITFLVAID